MKISISAACAAIVGACLFSTSVTAAPLRDPVTARVSLAGVDLTSESGRTAFQHRLRAAISTACAPRTGGLDAFGDSQQCRREMIKDASVQVAALLGRNGVQLASNVAPR